MLPTARLAPTLARAKRAVANPASAVARWAGESPRREAAAMTPWAAPCAAAADATVAVAFSASAPSPSPPPKSPSRNELSKSDSSMPMASPNALDSSSSVWYILPVRSSCLALSRPFFRRPNTSSLMMPRISWRTPVDISR